MIGLNASPNITRFAHQHGVTRQSVVDVLKLSFGNNLSALLDSNAFMTRDGSLRLSHGEQFVEFDVEALPFDVDMQLPASTLGVLTRVDGSETTVSILKTK